MTSQYGLRAVQRPGAAVVRRDPPHRGVEPDPIAEMGGEGVDQPGHPSVGQHESGPLGDVGGAMATHRQGTAQHAAVLAFKGRQRREGGPGGELLRVAGVHPGSHHGGDEMSPTSRPKRRRSNAASVSSPSGAGVRTSGSARARSLPRHLTSGVSSSRGDAGSGARPCVVRTKRTAGSTRRVEADLGGVEDRPQSGMGKRHRAHRRLDGVPVDVDRAGKSPGRPTRFQHHHVDAVAGQLDSGEQTGQPAAHHRHLDPVGHDRVTRCAPPPPSPPRARAVWCGRCRARG